MKFRIAVLVPYEETMVKPVVLYGVTHFALGSRRNRPWPHLAVEFDNDIESDERKALESDGVHFTGSASCEIPFEEILHIEEE